MVTLQSLTLAEDVKSMTTVYLTCLQLTEVKPLYEKGLLPRDSALQELAHQHQKSLKEVSQQISYELAVRYAAPFSELRELTSIPVYKAID